MFFIMVCVACSQHREHVEPLFRDIYASHYRNLQDVNHGAAQLIDQHYNYNHIRARALNDLAFFSIAKMDYEKADSLLSEIDRNTSNQIELLVSAVQRMRLCQRMSLNKEFYDCRDRAASLIEQIALQLPQLSYTSYLRYIYAQSEYHIVASAYFYYVGLYQDASAEIDMIDREVLFAHDTQQYLNLLYNLGSGGLIDSKDALQCWNQEVQNLIDCHTLATEKEYIYFQAQALQSMCEHLLQTPDDAPESEPLHLWKQRFFPEVQSDQLPLTLAQKALQLFMSYGDIYQIASCYRTLGQCHIAAGNYQEALDCLEKAMTLSDNITKAPALLSSISEQYSIVYAALGDKNHSDYYRNIYLDLQEDTRQDRQLEARAEQLSTLNFQQSVWLWTVVGMIAAVLVFLFVLDYLRRRESRNYRPEILLQPLKQWTAEQQAQTAAWEEQMEELKDSLAIEQQRLADEKRQYVEQRAKVSFLAGMIPLIDRMKREIENTRTADSSAEEQKKYVSELVEVLNRQNETLSNWIQLRRGSLRLRIESFPLQSVFNLVEQSVASFRLKDISLNVDKTSLVVKADKTLTAFMINTLADNARKFTDNGGSVTIHATEGNDYVEVSVSDTGIGMTQDELKEIFHHGVENNHGFGLMNCKGIIEQYKKVSRVFSVCSIDVESKKGKGSRFYFRLPKGVTRLLMIFCMMFAGKNGYANQAVGTTDSIRLVTLADSIYQCNVEGLHAEAIATAQKFAALINSQKLMPQISLVGTESDSPAEIEWNRKGLALNYAALLRFRNETAVAALALNRWDMYHYNNDAYIRLFRELSADSSLTDYVHKVAKTSADKNIAIALLVMLLLLIVPLYYLIYYRHRLAYMRNAKVVNKINSLLLGNESAQQKHKQIQQLADTIVAPEFQQVVNKIEETLEIDRLNEQEKLDNQSLIEDSLSRFKFEADRFHVANSVIDNGLSTLKHETMYFPSRIDSNMKTDSIPAEVTREMVGYYHKLFILLFNNLEAQSGLNLLKCGKNKLAEFITTDVNTQIWGDRESLAYLFEIVRKLVGNESFTNVQTTSSDRYITLTFLSTETDLSADHTPAFYICRQILRDVGEQKHARRCGISMQQKNEKEVEIQITMAIS